MATVKPFHLIIAGLILVVALMSATAGYRFGKDLAVKRAGKAFLIDDVDAGRN